MLATSIGENACRWICGATSFATREPVAVVLELVVRVDSALHAELGRAELDGLGDLLAELGSSTWYASGERWLWPKPQNAQPTVQMFVKLMLRLTTKLTSSPTSSSRSPSAAANLSISSSRVSLKSAVS